MLDDPHRASSFVERCSDCDDPATAACLRCARPVCELHASSDETRCGACEGQWRERASSLVPYVEPDAPEPFNLFKWVVFFIAPVYLVLVWLISSGIAIKLVFFALGPLYFVLFAGLIHRIYVSGHKRRHQRRIERDRERALEGAPSREALERARFLRERPAPPLLR